MRREMRSGRTFVPVERQEIIAHKLLVETRLRCHPVCTTREARSGKNPASALHRSRSDRRLSSRPNSNFVSAMIMPRVSRVRRAFAVEPDGKIAQLRGKRPAPTSPVTSREGDILVMESDLRLCRGREDRFGKLFRFLNPAGSVIPQTVPVSPVVIPSRTGDVPAHDALDRSGAVLLHQHAPAGKKIGTRTERFGKSPTVRTDADDVGTRWPRCWNQNAEICVSTLPLLGMPSGRTTSNAERRSVATMSRRSPRS